MLDPILSAADERATEADARIEELKEKASLQEPARGFKDALQGPGLSVIAEVKRRSPSAGDIAANLDPVAQAEKYAAGGAAAISVLTEPAFFGGSLDDLIAVRETVDLPILRKDFTRNVAQLWEARAAGADAVLLIVATLEQSDLVSLHAAALDIGLDAIVEAHTPEEVDRALAAGATLIGVNNRDLTTFRTDLSVAEGMAGRFEDGVVTIAESGVSSPEGASRMAAAGYDAVLVGEALVRAPDPAKLLVALRGEQ